MAVYVWKWSFLSSLPFYTLSNLISINNNLIAAKTAIAFFQFFCVLFCVCCFWSIQFKSAKWHSWSTNWFSWILSQFNRFLSISYFKMSKRDRKEKELIKLWREVFLVVTVWLKNESKNRVKSNILKISKIYINFNIQLW